MTSDHEAVCLSGPTQLNPQFLGAPVLEPATWENTATVTLSILDAWNVPTDSLFASVWDTTAVNTGVDHGACALCLYQTAEGHCTSLVCVSPSHDRDTYDTCVQCGQWSQQSPRGSHSEVY